jgi:hypothetical protein
VSGGGSRRVETIVGPFARTSRVPGTKTSVSPMSRGGSTMYSAFRQGAARFTVKNTTTART